MRRRRSSSSGSLTAGYSIPPRNGMASPGLSADGKLGDAGIPGSLLTAYLDQQGIVVEKTTDFTLLFLFSFGITKGKWGTLVNALLDFKHDYDRNTALERVLPALVAAHPEHYRDLGLH